MARSVLLCSVALALGSAASASTSAQAQEPRVEKLSFEAAGARRGATTVDGDLRIPASSRERMPAVVIVNSSPGFDGRGAFYAEALNRAGIATLEIDPYRGRGIPPSADENLPHLFESLRLLAARNDIDPARIGVMGFSWGADVAVVAAFDAPSRRHRGTGPVFAAHLALYPQCWYLRKAVNGKDRSLARKDFARTGVPIHILGGDRDAHDDPQSCARWIAALPAPARAGFTSTLYEGATFAWDSCFSSATWARGAHAEKGGMVEVIADPVIAEKSRNFAVEFFAERMMAK